MAHLQWSAEWWVWPHGSFSREVLLHFHSRSHSKTYKFASYNKNINAFANLLAISFPQAGKLNSADASPDDSTLMSIIYAIYLIWLYNTYHYKHCMFHCLSANWSMILQTSWIWNHCACDGLLLNTGGTRKMYDHKLWFPWFISIGEGERNEFWANFPTVGSTEAEVKT